MTGHTDPGPPSPPLVSAVIAAYKADHYLELAVGDAVGQTHPAVEVVVSDDAASAETRAVAARFGDRVRYRANLTRLGAAGNHRAGIEAAAGEWVAILNHDDRWQPTFLAEAMAAVAGRPEVVLVFCDHAVIDTAGADLPAEADRLARQYGRDRLTAGVQASLPALAARQAVPLAMGAVFRKAALDLAALPADAGPAYDLWLAYLLARSGGTAVYLPRRLTAWRVHPANLTSAAGADWLTGAAACWAAMAADPAFRPVAADVRRRAAAAHLALTRDRLRAGDRRAARRAASSALRFRPTSAKAAVAVALTCLPAVASRLLWAGRPNTPDLARP